MDRVPALPVRAAPASPLLQIRSAPFGILIPALPGVPVFWTAQDGPICPQARAGSWTTHEASTSVVRGAART